MATGLGTTGTILHAKGHPYQVAPSKPEGVVFMMPVISVITKPTMMARPTIFFVQSPLLYRFMVIFKHFSHMTQEMKTVKGKLEDLTSSR